ncbi:MAG: 5-formyltetrahydrofolate cyclo-ligase [Clostridia bacterium]|nr:5-formyltetrahydrofolate cyclo-ligase [Clostridia bacterium]
MKAKRRLMNKNEVVEKSQRAAEIFLNSRIYRSAKVIMLYMPLGNEADTKGIIKRAFEDGKSLVLPVTEEKTGKITAVAFEENTVLQKGGFSVIEPKNSKDVKKSDIDVVVVPGIAFDKCGARVGFGKGCYDMFLDGCKATKVGFCYEFQLCEGIPVDLHDVKMDFLLTETGMIEIKG